MKVRANRARLADAVRTAAVAAGVAPPVLSGARIDVGGESVVVTCSNLDLTIRATIPVDAVLEDGSAIVPAGLFGNFLKATDGESVNLAAGDGGSMLVESGETTITIPTLPVAEWPTLTTAQGTAVELSSAHLADLEKIVGFAWRNPKAPNPLLSGVHFAGGRAEATDRYRLARLELGVELGAPVVIPAEAIAVVLRGAGNRGVTLRTDARRATFATDDLEWTTSIVEGAYPVLDNVIRTESDHRVTFPTERLLDAVKRVALAIAEDAAQGMILTVDGGKTSVRNRATELGEIVDVVPSSGAMPETICVHGRHLRDILENVDDDEVVLEMQTARKPIEVRTERLLQLVMPVIEKAAPA